ncbi:GTP cyclohydrolase 1 type 2/Nif3 [Pestalotiopsis sp. NC0098]|nr:GTP cyclohydrolase 1 type 2/Nif3 [Pestalotiopsis sp. NC0098]
MASKYKLVFFVPTAAADAVKTAVLKAGAGQYPNYAEVCFTTAGTGQFRPVGEAVPHIGQVGQLERLDELRIETMCASEDVTRKAVEAIKKTHPYEVPVYEVYRIEGF